MDETGWLYLGLGHLHVYFDEEMKSGGWKMPYEQGKFYSGRGDVSVQQT